MANDARKEAPIGRGAASNRSGRFERNTYEDFDDGWGAGDVVLPPLKTTVTAEAIRSIITHNDSPDLPFDRSINPYKGCEHGCIYCFARPTHPYLGLSAGLDFESRLFSKPDAAAVLRQELRRPRYQADVLALGANTDPYQPIERRLHITRQILEVLAEHQHPVCIVTKSNLVLRDVDLLAPMGRAGLAAVMVSVTSLDRGLARRLEPRAPTPERRLEALAGLAEAGVPVGVLASPMIPALNDVELEKILEAAAHVGARAANYILVRLPREVADLFGEWLLAHYPDRAAHVLALIKDSRGGELNDPQFGTRMRGEGAYADMLARRFDMALKRFDLNRSLPSLRTDRFAVPGRGQQLALW